MMINSFKIEELLTFNNDFSILERIIEKKIQSVQRNVEAQNDEEKSLCETKENRMLELKVITKENEEEDVYVKLIEKNRIKESIFRYWTLIEEEVMGKRDTSFMPASGRRICILDLSRSENFKRNVKLEVYDNAEKSEILKKGILIYLVELEDYLKLYQEVTYKELIKYLPNISDYFLFVSVKNKC